MAKRYNIKGANSIIDKAIAIVGNYEHYAQEAGVPPHWIQKITEEIGYRIEGSEGEMKTYTPKNLKTKISARREVRK